MKAGKVMRMVASVLVPIAMLVSLAAWAVSSPPGSSPDEDYHLASIWCADGIQPGVCDPGPVATQRDLPADVVKAASCFAFDANKSGACDLHPEETTPTARGAWIDNGYPPVFYAVMHTFVSPDLSVSVVAMRLFNGLLFVALMTALFFFLPTSKRAPFLWGTALTLIPFGMFLIPSLNPSGWALISAAGVWAAVWGFYSQTGWRRWALAGLAAVFVIVGAGARSDAAAYAVIAMLAAAALSWQWSRGFALRSILPVALVAIPAYFFLTAGQSGILTAATQTPSDNSFAGLAWANLKLLPQLLVGVFGTWGLGWLDTTLPGLVWVTTAGVFAAVVFWGLRRLDLRKGVALAGVTLCIVAIPLYILMREQIVVGTGLQPRYILPLIVVLAGVAVTRFAGHALDLGRTQLVLLGAGLATSNAIALHTNLRRYITGNRIDSINLNAHIEWWWGPISPNVLWAGGSLAFAVVIGLLVCVLWPRPDVPEGARPPKAASIPA